MPPDLAAAYQQYAPELRRYIAAHVRDADLVEDLLSEVFLGAVRQLPDYEDRGHLRAWLYRIAHSRSVDALRRQARRPQELLEEASAREDGPERMIGVWDARSDVRRALPHLTPKQRRVIDLRFLAGLTIAEVAQLLGTNKGVVKALQHRALAVLREQLAAP